MSLFIESLGERTNHLGSQAGCLPELSKNAIFPAKLQSPLLGTQSHQSYKNCAQPLLLEEEPLVLTVQKTQSGDSRPFSDKPALGTTTYFLSFSSIRLKAGVISFLSPPVFPASSKVLGVDEALNKHLLNK